MKKLFTVLTMSILIFSASKADAQIRKIPSEVTDALKAKYPSASKVAWKDKITVFQASFQVNGEKNIAQINKDGQWMETERNLSMGKLSADVTDGFKKSKFSDWEVKEITQIEKNEGGTQYRLFIRKSDLEKKYLYFDKTGKMIKEAITL